jgi:hypothetical protein
MKYLFASVFPQLFERRHIFAAGRTETQQVPTRFVRSKARTAQCQARKFIL